jgi:molybdate transport system substrate-binding protein
VIPDGAKMKKIRATFALAVLGENISRTGEFVESGNADAGIVALSLVVSPTMKDTSLAWAIPDNLYAPIQQGAVAVRAAANRRGAQQFLDYIKMPATAALLERCGFVLAGKGKP